MTQTSVGRMMRMLDSLKPLGRSEVPVRPELHQDECQWFVAAVDAGLVRFQTCTRGCSRLRRSGVPGPDEFTTPAGARRHLYSAPGTENLRLNREYVPHIAAVGYVVLEAGYDIDRASFSRYGKFSKNLISKRAGQSYETDAEFYDAAGNLYLHVEVKTWPGAVDRIVQQLDEAQQLRDLPEEAAKEIEYVLDLSPRYLWIVGPGSVDPPAHVYSVMVDGLTAQFDRVDVLPTPT